MATKLTVSGWPAAAPAVQPIEAPSATRMTHSEVVASWPEGAWTEAVTIPDPGTSTVYWSLWDGRSRVSRTDWFTVTVAGPEPVGWPGPASIVTGARVEARANVPMSAGPESVTVTR